MKNLVIVESPAKAKNIEGFLGSDYVVMPSYGHIRDLAKKEMSIDIANNYEPQYQITEDKHKLVSELQKAVKEAEHVWLASDEDREGEAIAWHLFETLKLDPSTTQRITFNAVTKKDLLDAIAHPRQIDMNLVNAQQARRVLDRIVGYEISPILWAKIKPELSAGRVQSVSVRLIVEREEEIKNFVTKSYFRVTATFLAPGSTQHILAELSHRFDTEADAMAFMQDLTSAQFTVADVTTKPMHRTPAAPFTTSTLQQEASRKLGYSVARTMQVAQQLYEEGFITYMRTDSVNLSDYALEMARDAISDNYGSHYYKLRHYKTDTKGAQEAHEAIRPTNIAQATIQAEPPARRLYELIWKRTIASQMADAEVEKTTIDIAVSNHNEHFTCTGEQILFDGFLKVYIESSDDEPESADAPTDSALLPKITTGTTLTLSEADAQERFTQHPPRFTEASLVKKLEELGIGRPSTYAPTISTILKREYVIKEDREPEERQTVLLKLKEGTVDRTSRTEHIGGEKNKLFPTDIGVVVNKFLIENFDTVLDYNFTANVEKDFDEIAEGKKVWQDVINDFYQPFHKRITFTQENSKKTNGSRLVGVDPASGKNIYAKIGRFGPIVQLGDTESDEKPRFAGLRSDMSIETVTVEQAMSLLSLPRTVGKFEGLDVTTSIGRFGPYIRLGDHCYPLAKEDSPYDVTLERCIETIEKKRVVEKERARLREIFPRELGKYEGEPVQVNTGRFGPYLTYKENNYRLPKGEYDPEKMTLAEAVAVILASEKKARTKKKK